MLIFKDEDLGLTYECTTAEELGAAVAIHQRTHHQSICAASNLKADLTNVVKEIKPMRFTEWGSFPVYPSDFTQGLGAGKSIEQGDEGLPQPAEWLSPPQYSEPPATLTPAEEALANAYQEQDHQRLQAEVMRLREVEKANFEVIQNLRQKLKEQDLQIEFIGQPPKQPGEAIQARQEPIVPIWSPEFKGWNQFVEIMNNHGFGTQENEDRSSVISYLKALDRYLNKLVEFHSAAQDAQRVLDSKDQMIGQYRATLERVEGRHSLLKTDCDELRQEVIALKKGNATLTAKLQRNEKKHEREMNDLTGRYDLTLAEKERLDLLLRNQMEMTRTEVKIREQAVNDNIALSETNKTLREKLEFCLKAVPSIESAWELYRAQGAKSIGIS